jgi:hypothetical protein
MDYKLIGDLKHELALIDERRSAIEKVILLYAPLPPTAVKEKPRLLLARELVADIKRQGNGNESPPPPPAERRRGDLEAAVIDAIRSFPCATFTALGVLAWMREHRAHLGAACIANKSTLSNLLSRLAARGHLARAGRVGTALTWRRLASIEKAPSMESRYREFEASLPTGEVKIPATK